MDPDKKKYMYFLILYSYFKKYFLLFQDQYFMLFYSTKELTILYSVINTVLKYHSQLFRFKNMILLLYKWLWFIDTTTLFSSLYSTTHKAPILSRYQ